MKKKALILTAVVIVLAMLAAYLVFGPAGRAGIKSVTVEVQHLNGGEAHYEIRTKAEYLRKALEDANLVKGSETSYGLWVETVDGETADETKEEWWGYTVNGEFAVYGVDSQPVSDGDIYVFTLNVGY